ncbi:MAG: hypothetical protein LBJ40_05115 [Delftia acidovorans]|nr:hypothetical protein [Delftia acidovorans]
MWPFSLLKKLSQDPPVGQTRGDYIGCYLLGTEAPGQAGVSYVSLATTREQLQADARTYLEGFVRDHPEAADADLSAIRSLLENLPQRLDAHLSGDTRVPLAEQGGTVLFLRTGMRARRKENGRYLE